MKRITCLLLSCCLFTATLVSAQSVKKYNIFTYTAPKGFVLKKLEQALFYEKKEGKSYCQIFLYPAVNSLGEPALDFDKDWNSFARNASQGVTDPETRETDTTGNWQIIMGGARGQYNRQPFVITLTTISNGSLSYYAAAVFTEQKYIAPIREFIGSIQPDTTLFTASLPVQGNTNPATGNTIQPGNTTGITKSTTRFDDGWLGTPAESYVKLTRDKSEIRLYYPDEALENARPNTIDAPEYYWSKYISPFYDIPNPEKWSGVQYPVIYHMQGYGRDRQTGSACYLAIKIVYSGGARPIVVKTTDQQTYQQLFPHPNDIDRMLYYNKFAVTAADITGKWKGGGGGSVNYYSVYTGNWAGYSSLSTSDEFTFNSNGTYSSEYRSASSSSSGSRFGAVDYKGNFSVSDWSISASNRYGGKATHFHAQLIAIKGGFLLYLEDPENKSMNYTLFKIK